MNAQAAESDSKRVWEIARAAGCTARQAQAVLAAAGIETRSTSSKVRPTAPEKADQP